MQAGQGSHTIFKTKFHDIPLHLKYFFHACLSDIYTCKLVTVLSGFFLKEM